LIARQGAEYEALIIQLACVTIVELKRHRWLPARSPTKAPATTA
jgi:hypothetical protein